MQQKPRLFYLKQQKTMKFTKKDFVQITIVPVVTGALIWHGYSIPWSIFWGFMSSFLPSVPGAIVVAAKAFVEGVHEPLENEKK
jgi:hypothetical protein